MSTAWDTAVKKSENLRANVAVCMAVACSGTNFLVRAKAFMEVGGSPTYTLTEDFALGMELKKLHWQCRYVQARSTIPSNFTPPCACWDDGGPGHAL